MKLRWSVALVLMVPVFTSADEIVQPPFSPSSTMVPIISNLVDKNQQTHDAATLQSISTALEQTLAKHDNNKKKTQDKKESKEQKGADANKRLFAEEQLHAATTEFLRASEFTRLVTIKTKKIALRDALSVLAKQAGIHLLIDHDVKGDLPSLHAELIPVSAVMQMVLDAHKPPLSLIRVARAWRVVLRSRAEELMRSIIQGDISADRVEEP